MTEFDKLNLRVVPIQDPVKFNKRPNYNGRSVAWSDPATWCDWEEREDIYPGVKDWYVIPPARSTFIENGIEVGYWVLDVDNHEGDKFEEACEFLRSCHLPPSLTIRTPSGGIHRYYKALKDDLPAPLGRNKELNLPIEIKVSTGVVAPNGRDRVIIQDIPVAYFTITEDNPIAKIAKIKQNRTYGAKKETDPNFPIEDEPFPEVGPGDRHNTLMATACSLYARGCPPEKIQEWGEEFYLRSGRKQQPNEIANIVRDAMNYVDGDEAEAEAELQELVDNATEDVNKTEEKVDINPLEGAVELTGWEGAFAKVIFSDKEESKKYISEELKNIPEQDKPLIRPLITSDMNKMREAWVKMPVEKQIQYEYLKDTIKSYAEKS